MSNESKGMLLGFLGVMVFGLTLPATRFIVPYLDPVFVGLGRAVVAGVVAFGKAMPISENPPTQSRTSNNR